MRPIMPSVGLGGKIYRSFFTLLVFLLGGSPVLSQKGYMGKGNELGLDLFNALYQGVYELEYKGVLNKHLGLILSAGYYASEKDYRGRPIEGDPLSSLTTGPTFGIGLGNNRARLGMAYPIGYCMSYGYKISLLEIEDRYQRMDDPVRFEHNVHQFYVRFTRTYNLTEYLNLQLSVRTGTLMSSVQRVGGLSMEEAPDPLRVLPAKHPFFENGTYQIQEFPTDQFKLRFYAMPMIRVAYLF